MNNKNRIYKQTESRIFFFVDHADLPAGALPHKFLFYFSFDLPFSFWISERTIAILFYGRT